MAAKIKLARIGSKGRPFYRVVVMDQRAPRDGDFIEELGVYHPLSDPPIFDVKKEKTFQGSNIYLQKQSIYVEIGAIEPAQFEQIKKVAAEKFSSLADETDFFWGSSLNADVGGWTTKRRS